MMSWDFVMSGGARAGCGDEANVCVSGYFLRCPFARALTFKGGATLSKAFGPIQRFSADADLILASRS